MVGIVARTVAGVAVFTAACGPTSTQTAAPIAPSIADRATAPQPPPPASAPVTRATTLGETCVTDGDCGDLRCAPTVTAGRSCHARCDRDADCDGARGVFCDAAWGACAIPGSLALVAPACPAAGARDPSLTAAADPELDATPFGPLAPIARDAAGFRFAVGVVDGAPMIAVATPRAPWGTLQPIASDECDPATGDGRCTHPRLALARGRLVVAYAIAGGGIRVRASRDNGATWSAPITAAPGIEPAITSAPDGRVWIAALDGAPLGERGGAYGSADRRVVVALSRDGGATFATARPASGLDEPIPRLFAAPSLDYDARRGTLYLAYTRGSRTSPWEVVLAALHDDRKPPKPPVASTRGAPLPPPPPWKRTRVSTHDCAYALAPSLAVDDATGLVHLAYYDTHGGGRLVHATCGATCTERGAVDDADLALSLAPGDDAPRAPSVVVAGGALRITWQAAGHTRAATTARR